MEQVQRPMDRYMDLYQTLVLDDLSPEKRAQVEEEMSSIKASITSKIVDKPTKLSIDMSLLREPKQVQRQMMFLSGYYTEEGIFVRSEFDDTPYQIAGPANDEQERDRADKWMREHSTPEVEFHFGNIEYAKTLLEKNNPSIQSGDVLTVCFASTTALTSPTQISMTLRR